MDSTQTMPEGEMVILEKLFSSYCLVSLDDAFYGLIQLQIESTYSVSIVDSESAEELNQMNNYA